MAPVDVAVADLSPATVARHTAVCHMWMNYDAKDLYERWEVSKSTILNLRARLEVTTSTLRDKNKEIFSCERRLFSNEST